MTPRRIVALAAEAPEILHRLGAFDRLVGATAYARRPEAVRRLPRLGGFSTPDLEKALDLRPDLVITTSAVQAQAAAWFAERGVEVLALDPHRLDDVWRGIASIGRALGAAGEAERLIGAMKEELARVRARHRLARPVRVYFEEWDDPMIAGIGWVSDLVHFLGGEDVFRELAGRPQAAGRVVTPEAVLARAPEVVIASWCGKRVRPERIRARPGWAAMPAVARGQVHAIPSDEILQAGPSLLRGARRLAAILKTAARTAGAPPAGGR